MWCTRSPTRHPDKCVCLPDAVGLGADEEPPEVGLASVVRLAEAAQRVDVRGFVVVGPLAGVERGHDQPAAPVEFLAVDVRERQVVGGDSGVVLEDVAGRALAHREQDVSGDGAKFSVEERLHLHVVAFRRVAVRDAGVKIREEEFHRLAVVVEQARRGQRAPEALAAVGSRERHARLGAAVDARMVADDVEVGVRVAVPRDERLAGRLHAERVARSVRDVLHAAA